MMQNLFKAVFFTFIFCLSLISAPLSADSEIQSEIRSEKQLKNGWYPWDPYQYVEGGEGFKTLTGLDIQLVKAISKKAKYNSIYEEISWKTHLDEIKNGTRDFAAGATWTEERAKFAYYSIPYRREENALYVRKGELGKYQFGDVPQTLQAIPQQ